MFHAIFTDRQGREWISREVKTVEEWVPAGNVPARGEKRGVLRANPWGNQGLALTGLHRACPSLLRRVLELAGFWN